MLKNAVRNAEEGYATNFGIEVPDPERFGIMEVVKTIDGNRIISVEEKPENPKSNIAITGLYFYPKGVSQRAKLVKPSKRGELEITSLNDMYLKDGILKAEVLNDDFEWYDTGVFNSLNDASNAIRAIQKKEDKIIACLEGIGYENGWLRREEIKKSGILMQKNSYGEYLLKLSEREKVEV